MYKYTSFVKLLLRFNFSDLHWWHRTPTSLIHSEPDLKMGTFVLQALLGDEIRDRAKAFEPQSFNDNFSWPFIFHSALKATISIFLFIPWQPQQSTPSLCLWVICVMFRLNMPVWCSRFFFFFLCLLTCCRTLPLCVHLLGNPLPGQLLLPFSSFMLNSNHYFQRKASLKLLYWAFVPGGGKPLSNTHSDCSFSS